MRGVRVFYEKYGRMKFVSHLDMNRFMNRMVRISGIPVWYSEGFNPHPYITFALPLSLGFESRYEVMDIRLDDDSYTNDQVFSALSGVVPEGIRIVKAADPVMKAGEIAFAEFEIVFEQTDTEFAEQLNNFLSEKEIFAEKKSKKGKLNTINLAEFIKSFALSEKTLTLILAAGGSKNLNPTLLLETFERKIGVRLPTYSVTRTMLYDEALKSFV